MTWRMTQDLPQDGSTAASRIEGLLRAVAVRERELADAVRHLHAPARRGGRPAHPRQHARRAARRASALSSALGLPRGREGREAPARRPPGLSPAYLDARARARGLGECLCREVFASGHGLQARNTTDCPRMPMIGDGSSSRSPTRGAARLQRDEPRDPQPRRPPGGDLRRRGAALPRDGGPPALPGRRGRAPPEGRAASTTRRRGPSPPSTRASASRSTPRPCSPRSAAPRSRSCGWTASTSCSAPTRGSSTWPTWPGLPHPELRSAARCSTSPRSGDSLHRARARASRCASRPTTGRATRASTRTSPGAGRRRPPRSCPSSPARRRSGLLVLTCATPHALDRGPGRRGRGARLPGLGRPRERAALRRRRAAPTASSTRPRPASSRARRWRWWAPSPPASPTRCATP